MTDSSAKLTFLDGTSGATFALEIKKPVRDAFTRLATRVHCWPRRRSNALQKATSASDQTRLRNLGRRLRQACEGWQTMPTLNSRRLDRVLCGAVASPGIDGQTLAVERNNFADGSEQEYEPPHVERILGVVTASRWTHITTTGVEDD
jgi:hypothetical protein